MKSIFSRTCWVRPFWKNLSFITWTVYKPGHIFQRTLPGTCCACSDWLIFTHAQWKETYYWIHTETLTLVLQPSTTYLRVPYHSKDAVVRQEERRDLLLTRRWSLKAFAGKSCVFWKSGKHLLGMLNVIIPACITRHL